MSTAPKMKALKAAGKQKTPAQTVSGEADNAFTRASTRSSFEEALCAARALLLGPPDGEPGKIGELERETWESEQSTGQAIDAAQPTEKLGALYSGSRELQHKLCASAAKYYHTCFELALPNRAEMAATRKVSNPAEFAHSLTSASLSTFLRVTSLDGKEKAREIESNGRVREFVRHVCGDYSDVFLGQDQEPNVVFLLPRWPTGRSFGSRLGQWPITPASGDESSTLSLEETEEFILGTEETIIENLRHAIADAHRIALVALGKSGITVTESSKTNAVAARINQNNRARAGLKPRSRLNKAIRMAIMNKPKATAEEICEWIDSEAITELPLEKWPGCDGSLCSAYSNPDLRNRLDSAICKVRKPLKAAGII